MRLASLGADTFLPGVALAPGGLIVDAEQLRSPGDPLHEAGHLAFSTSSIRAATDQNAGPNMGYGIAAQAWSYVASLHLGLAPQAQHVGIGLRLSLCRPLAVPRWLREESA